MKPKLNHEPKAKYSWTDGDQNLNSNMNQMLNQMEAKVKTKKINLFLENEPKFWQMWIEYEPKMIKS